MSAIFLINFAMVPSDMRESFAAGKDIKREERNHKTEDITKCREEGLFMLLCVFVNVLEF